MTHPLIAILDRLSRPMPPKTKWQKFKEELPLIIFMTIMAAILMLAVFGIVTIFRMLLG